MDTTYRLSQTGKEVQALLDKVTPNEEAITQEQQRAEGAEQQLQTNIETEQQRAETAEQQLQENIDAIGRGGAAAVTEERERAEAAEQQLQENINTEQQERIADVDAEEQRARTAEEQNATGITTERNRAEASEQQLQDNIDAEQLRAHGAEQQLQTNINNEQTRAQQAEQLLDGKIAQEQQRAEGVEGDLQADIDTINGKIPAAASPQNKLVDQNLMNSSIQTATAEFKGTFNSKGELDQVTANANDYAYVVSKDTEGNTVYSRYKWVDGTGWMFEYNLNNSSFTAAQWAAIQSGITALLVSKLANLPTNDVLQQLIGTKQDRLTFDTTPTENSTNPVQSGGIYHALEHKQDSLTFDEQPTQYSRNPVISGALFNIFQSIQSLFPQAASRQNPLADRQWVSDQITADDADFVGIYTSLEQLEELTGATKNDFAFVVATDTAGNTIYTRYDYDGEEWKSQYSLASNRFTLEEWQSIQSGITATLTEKLRLLPNPSQLSQMFENKQDKLTFDTVPTQGSQNPVTSEGIANAILAAAGVQFIDVSVLPTASAATMGKIYLVPNQEQPNASDWYVTIYDAQHDPVYYWKQVNTTSVDLSDYYKKEEVDTKVTRLQTQIGERNVTVEAQAAPTSDTLTYTNALGETANHIVGDKRIVPNQDASSGYDTYILLHLADGVATWGAGGGDTDIRQKLWINLTSNQGAGDTSLNGTSVLVEADDETILDTTWSGETVFCRISPLKQVKVTVGSKAGYYLASNVQTFESSVAGERTINFNYETCVVKFQPTSNQGAGDSTIEQATGTINGTAVNYGGTLKVAMGQPVTIHCNAIENYVTPADYTGTASTAELTPALVYQTTLVTISWESNLGADPVIDDVQATVARRTVSSGQTIKVATGTEVTVVFPEVEGYRTPVIAPFTAEGTTVIKPTVQYATDIYTAVIDSNQTDKTDIANARLTVGYTPASGEPVSRTLASGDTIKIPAGTVPTATATDISGYRKTVTVSDAAKTITAQYDTTLVSVNATSNQSTQQITDPVLTGLVFGINGTEVTAGQQVKVPTGSALTITSPDITHYAKQVNAAATAEGQSYMATIAYQTTLVMPNMVSNVAGVETSAPAGAAATVTYQGGAAQTVRNGEYAKVPTGTAFDIAYVAVSNYGTPTSYSGTASGTSMTVQKAEYVQGVVVINISMSDSDAAALALAGATVSINDGEPIAYTGQPIPVAPVSNVLVHFNDVEGYATPADQQFIMPTGTKTVSASYDTTIFTAYVTSNQQDDQTIAAQKVSVTYTGLASPKQLANGETVKVPTGLTPTATATDVTGYAKSVSVNSANRTITAAYQTTIISVNMAGENAGVEGAAPQGAQATVSYQGGTDQVLTDNTQTANVPTGTEFTITYGPVNSYATPASYTATASGTSMTAPKAVYIYGVVQLTVSMSDGDSQALALVAPTISINSGAYRAMTGSGGVFTANLNTGDTYNIRFNALTEEGYQTPADISGTKGSGVETVTAEYLTTIYTVAVTSSLPDDPIIAGQLVSVSYDGLATAKQVGNGGTVKVPANLVPTATAPDVQGYGKTISVDSINHTITAAYVYGVLNIEVSMSDNDNTALADVTATIAVNGGTPQAMEGTVDTTAHKKTFSASLNVGDTYVVSFGTVEGYATPADISGTKASGVETATAEYETDIYTLTVTGQSRQETIEYQQDGQTVSQTISSGNAVKVPAGTVPTVASAYVKGYARTVTIGTVTAHAATITVAYSTTAYSVSMTSNQTGDQVIAALQATVGWTYDGHTESETLNSGDTVNVPTGVTPTVTFPDATGYTKSVTSSGTAYTAAYTTEIITVALASDTGEADLSGVTITVTDTTASAAVSPFATSQYKIPSGHGYSVSVSDDVEGYKAPDAVTGTATSGTDAALTVTMTYEEQAGFVDLGLPSGKKWAIGNLVKDSQGNYSIGEETDWGTYVSWGNIIGHNEGEGYNFDQTTYDSTPGKQVAANIPSNDAAHDIALATLGTPWHLPTKEDCQELYDNTDSEWVSDYNGTGVAGRKFMKKSDHSVYVFFPASGLYNGTSLYGRGTYGFYWSSSFLSSSSAYDLGFGSSSVYPQNYSTRRYGMTVRPVQ